MKAREYKAEPLKVLVVDNDVAQRMVLSTQIRELGHEVGSVSDLDEVRHWLLNQRTDLVLLDISTHPSTQEQVSQCIQSLPGDRWLPLIVTISEWAEAPVVKALHLGAEDYLVRPIAPALLCAKLGRVARVQVMHKLLAALANRHRDIQDNILDAVLTVDEHAIVIAANRAANARFAADRPTGMTSDSAPGLASHPAQNLVGLSVLAVTGTGLAILLGGARVTLRDRSGHMFPAEVRASTWKESGAIRTTLLFHDLSERQHTERMRDEFLATVSHELRTPLTSVLGAVSLLNAGAAGPLSSAGVTLTAAAQRNGQRLSRLIDDILDLTKLEGDRMVLHCQVQALAPLLREAVVATQAYADANEVSLFCTIDEPSAFDEVAVDADRFLQIMANLLSNAIKHSPKGATVEVRLSTGDSGCVVTVRDRGPGISAEFRDRLFQKFSQADSSDHRNVAGTGLGLYITRMLVERMGGRIDAAECEGAGAQFSVWLPRQSHAKNLPLVLLIDCDIDARARMLAALSGCARVHCVGVLSQANVSSREPCDLVLANPQGQGSVNSFCKAVRRLAGSAPVLFVSDSVDPVFARSKGFAWLSALQIDSALRKVSMNLLHQTGMATITQRASSLTTDTASQETHAK
jgi:signal transduction histidine kinase